MITRINQFQAAAGKSDELHGFLRSLTTYITASEGCISYEVLRSASDSGSFAVIERWASIAAHQKSVAAFPKDQMQAAMSLFSAPPMGDYFHS